MGLGRKAVNRTYGKRGVGVERTNCLQAHLEGVHVVHVTSKVGGIHVVILGSHQESEAHTQSRADPRAHNIRPWKFLYNAGSLVDERNRHASNQNGDHARELHSTSSSPCLSTLYVCQGAHQYTQTKSRGPRVVSLLSPLPSPNMACHSWPCSDTPRQRAMLRTGEREYSAIVALWPSGRI